MAARKSMQFLYTLFTQTKSKDDIVKDKLKPGKFVFTPSGILCILGITCLLAAITFFLTSSKCSQDSTWKLYVFIVSNGLTILVAMVLYLMFSTGETINDPWFWIRWHIILNVFVPIACIACSVASVMGCTNTSQLHDIPMPLSITGSALLIISSAALVMLYRYQDEEIVIQVPTAIPPPPPPRTRKSLLV